MKKFILALAAALSLGSAAHAVTFTGTAAFTDDINSVNPGIQAKAVVLPNFGPQDFVSAAVGGTLNVGDTLTMDLFIVRTLATVATLDDYVAESFALEFATDVGTAVLTGSTVRVDTANGAAGLMDFNGPVVIALGGGIGLFIEMADLLFNEGSAPGTYTPGKANGGLASVTFSVAEIPLPAAGLLLLAGLGGLAAVGRRRGLAV